MDSEKKLLMTMTGEMHQPVRLYYEVYDQAAVVHAFAKLRCMDDDRDQERWVWLYHGEAKKLKFHTSYALLTGLKKWTFDLSMPRVASRRHIFEANVNGFPLVLQVHGAKPLDDLA